jgi:hypothetical protein
MKLQLIIWIVPAALLAGCAKESPTLSSNETASPSLQSSTENKDRFEQLVDSMRGMAAQDLSQAKNSSVASAPPKPAPRSQTDQEKKSGLVVKGFYLGMNREAAMDAIAAQGLVVERPIVGLKSQTYSGSKVSAIVYAKGTKGGRLIAMFGEGQELVGLEMSSALVNDLFNVRDLSAESFATTFLDAYDIPLMEPLEGGRRGWKYVDERSGTEVAIYSGKNVAMVKVPTTMQRRFD